MNGLQLTHRSWLLGVLVSLSACKDAAPAQPEPEVTKSTATTPKPRAEAEPQADAVPPVANLVPGSEKKPLLRGVEVSIPAGKLRVGSPTGARYRDPSREADDLTLTLSAFKIDALPYPNDPAVPPKVDVDRKEATKLCEAEGKRLCSELEWERACKGDENLEYPAPGSTFDAAACKAKPAECQSPFGVFALGAFGREWTANEVTRGLGDSLRTAVVRGASAGENTRPSAYRCAARDAATPDSRSSSLTFRCCRGPVQPLKYPEEPTSARFVEKTLSREELGRILKGLPSLADVSETFRLFSAREIEQGLDAAHTSRVRMAPWLAAGSVLEWSPVHGETVWVLSGDTPRGAMLLALYPVRDQRFILIGTMEAANEHTPFIVGYKPDAPAELLFSTCWGCGGEGGAIKLGEDARVAIEPR